MLLEIKREAINEFFMVQLEGRTAGRFMFSESSTNKRSHFSKDKLCNCGKTESVCWMRNSADCLAIVIHVF